MIYGRLDSILQDLCQCQSNGEEVVRTSVGCITCHKIWANLGQSIWDLLRPGRLSISGQGGSPEIHTLILWFYGAHCIKYPSNHFNPLESHSWGQVGCQIKGKSSRNSFFFVSAATFQSELNNLQKRPKYVKKCKNAKMQKNKNCSIFAAKSSLKIYRNDCSSWIQDVMSW